MRRDVGGHADGDAGAAVDDEVGDARREDGGLEGGLVVVGGEVYGVGVDVGEHLAGDLGEAGFGVTHGGGWVAVDGAEVALAVDHGVTEAEGLGHADHGVVDGGVAVGVVVAHDVADDLGGLGVLLVELEAHLLHTKEDAAVDGLEAVADVGQGSADDDRHGVVEIRAAHLLFHVNGEHEGGAAALNGAGGGAIWVVLRREGELRVLFVCHDLSLYYRGFHGGVGRCAAIVGGYREVGLRLVRATAASPRARKARRKPTTYENIGGTDLAGSRKVVGVPACARAADHRVDEIDGWPDEPDQGGAPGRALRLRQKMNQKRT